MHMYLLPFEPPSPLTSHPSRSTRLGSLCYTAASHYLSVLHMILCICRCYFFNSSYPLLTFSLFPLLCPQVHSPSLHLLSFHVSRFISAICLDSVYIYINIQYLFFSFWLTSLCTTEGCLKERKDIVPNKSASGISSEPEVHARFLPCRVLWTNFALGESSSL